MVGLIDIVPLVERVTIRGHEVEVRGLDLTQLGLLLWRFPEFRKLYETRRLDVEALLAAGAPAVAALVAASCPDTITEESARNLAPGEQAEILAKILKITMPSGVGPFVEILGTLALGNQAAAVPSVLALVTNSGILPASSAPTASPMQ
jgi:hypothetical protein